MTTVNSTKEQEVALVKEKSGLLYTDPRTNKYSEFFLKFRIIIRPDVIWQLLDLFELLESDIKIVILEQIRESLQRFPLNSLILASKTMKKMPNGEDENIIEAFIKHALKFAEKSPEMIEDLLDVVSILSCYNKLERNHLTLIYSNLSEKFYSQKLTSDIVFYSLRMLNKILSNQNSNVYEPPSFFYFTGMNSGLTVGAKRPIPWLFTTGFGLGIWFYLEDANEDLHNAKDVFELTGKACPKLFTIHCQGGGGLEAYFLGNKLYYRILPPNYNEPVQGSNGVEVGVFQSKTWYYLGLEHEVPRLLVGRSQLSIVINTEKKKAINIDFPKISKDMTISKFVIGENLIGRVSSVVLFQSAVNQSELMKLHSFFSLGIQTNANIRNFNVSMEKLLEKILLLYTPIRTVGNVCYDIFGAYHGSLQGNSGFINKDNTQFRFGALGGVTSILPFFYLLRFIDNQQHRSLLDELLKIVIFLFRNRPENQFEAIKIGFFRVMGQLLSETNRSFLSSESIELFAELKNCLNDQKLTEEMFIGLLWKTELYDDVSDEIREQAWKYLRTIYLQNAGYYFSLFSIRNIIELLVEKYDKPFKKIASAKYHTEWNSSRSPDFQVAEKVFKPILSIIEVTLFAGGDLALETVNNIVTALTFKCSPYLYILMLKLLKNFMRKKDDPKSNSRPILQFLIETRAIKNFLFLMTNTSCLDLKSLCIKYLNILTTSSPNANDQIEIANYVSGTLWPSSSDFKERSGSHKYSVDFPTLNDESLEEIKPKFNIQKQDSMPRRASITSKEPETASAIALNKVMSPKRDKRASSVSISPSDYEASFTWLDSISRSGSQILSNQPNDDARCAEKESNNMSDSQAARLQDDPINVEATPFDISNTSEIKRTEEIINEDKSRAVNVITDKEQNKQVEVNKEDSRENDVDHESGKMLVKEPKIIIRDSSDTYTDKDGRDEKLNAEEQKVNCEPVIQEKPKEDTSLKPKSLRKKNDFKKNQTGSESSPDSDSRNLSKQLYPEENYSEFSQNTAPSQNTETLNGDEASNLLGLKLRPLAPLEHTKSDNSSLRSPDANKSVSTKSPRNQVNADEVTFDMLYTALLEWLLHKEPTGLEDPVMIDDSDKILSTNAILIMIKFYKHSSEDIKQKMIQDLFMLVKWNSMNCNALIKIQEFQFFLLDVLCDCQVALFQHELRDRPAAIWELGVKTHTILLKLALINEPESYQRLQLLFTWVTSKRLTLPKRFERTEREVYGKAMYYLVRHLYLNLLESVEDNSNNIYPFSRSNFWNNLLQMAFYVERIISSAFNSGLSHIARTDSEIEKISPLASLITKVKSEEVVPFNFLDIIQKSKWTDWKLCETFIKIFSPLWNKFGILSYKEDEKLNEMQNIEKKITLMMDIVKVEEQSKILELFFTESKEKELPNRGCFLQILVEILACNIEEALRAKSLERINWTCRQIEDFLIYLIIVGENVREKNMNPQRKGLITASIVYLIRFLYQLLEINKKEVDTKVNIIRTIRNVMLHLIWVVDYIYSRPDNISSLNSSNTSVSSTNSSRDSSKTNFTMISFDIVHKQLTKQAEPILPIHTIKALKSENFLSLNDKILSKEWKRTVLESEEIQDIVNEHYKPSLEGVTAEISRRLENRSYSFALKNTRNEKVCEEVQKKYGDEILEVAVDISEQEDYKKQAFLANEEEYIRSAKNSWKKLWKRMRIYVGQWKHPRFYDQIDRKYNAEKEAFNLMKKNRFFRHRGSKYETKSRTRPFLKLKLIEPEYVEEYNKLLAEKREDIRSIINTLSSTVFFNQSVLSELPNSAKKFSIFSFGKNFKKKIGTLIPVNPQVNHLKVEATMSRLGSPVLTKASVDSPLKQEILLTKRCQWIKTLTIRNGFLQISTQKISFILEGLDQKENHIAFLKYSLPEDRKITKEWSIESIKEIQRRRYIFRKSALEFLLKDGSTLLFNFSESDLEEISSAFLGMKKTRYSNLVYHGLLDPKKLADKSGVTKKWLNREISNFTYLMHLNALSGRSYKDLTQYPVFPWILRDYGSEYIDLGDPGFYRDLNRPLGALGSQERIDTFTERFENNDTFDPVPAFHYGSHYSSPAIVLQYLVRLSPYTEGAIQLQSGKFDLADRLFYSMQESYRGATEEIADVRELVPEFFFLPDFLINEERLDFGVTQYGLRVNHVATPKWSFDNPYHFVALLREALESEIVSKQIHNWIDLIFGYKQSGKEAEKSLNVFYYMTYEEKVDLNLFEDPSTKISYESQIVHFGQTPSQLFVKPHPQRSAFDFHANAKIISDYYEEVAAYPLLNKHKSDEKILANQNSSTNNAILKLKFITEHKLVCCRKDGRILYLKLSSNNSDLTNLGPFKCSIEKEKFVNLERGRNENFTSRDTSITYLSYPLVFLNMGKAIASGGYWDGRLSLHQIENDTVESYHVHNDTITAIALDEKEKFLITGSKSGECIVWNILLDAVKLTVRFQFYDHEAMINYIFISNEMRLFATASNDGKVNIYHTATSQLMRTIYHHLSLPIEMVVLTSSPLPAVVFYSSEDRTFYSYSINGRLIEAVVEEFAHAITPTILKDSNFIESMIYSNEKGELITIELPFLCQKKKWDVSPGSPIFSVVFPKDFRYLLCGSENGDISVLIDRNSLAQSYKRADEDLDKLSRDAK